MFGAFVFVSLKLAHAHTYFPPARRALTGSNTIGGGAKRGRSANGLTDMPIRFGHNHSFANIDCDTHTHTQTSVNSYARHNNKSRKPNEYAVADVRSLTITYTHTHATTSTHCVCNRSERTASTGCRISWFASHSQPQSQHGERVCPARSASTKSHSPKQTRRTQTHAHKHTHQHTHAQSTITDKTLANPASEPPPAAATRNCRRRRSPASSPPPSPRCTQLKSEGARERERGSTAESVWFQRFSVVFRICTF